MRRPYFWDYPPHRRRVLTATAATCLAGLVIASAGQLHWTAPTDPAKPTLLAERASQNPVPTRKSDDASESPGGDDSSGSAPGSDGEDSDRGSPGGSGSVSSSGEDGGAAAETSPGSASASAAGSVLPPVAGSPPGVGQPGDGPLEKPGVGEGPAAAVPLPTSGAALPAPVLPAPSLGSGSASSPASSGGSSDSGSRRVGRGARTDSTADAPPQAAADRAARQQRIRRALPPGFVPTAPASPRAVSQPAGALATASSARPPVPGSSAVSVPVTSPALTQAVPPVAGGSSSWPGAQPGAALTPVACPAGVTVAGATCYQSQATQDPGVSGTTPSAPAVAAVSPEVGSSTSPAMSLPAAAPTRSAASDAPVNVNGHGCQLFDQVRYHATGNWWGDLMSWAMGQAQQCAQDMGGSGGWNSYTGSGGSSSSSGSSKKSHRKASDK